MTTLNYLRDDNDATLDISRSVVCVEDSPREGDTSRWRSISSALEMGTNITQLCDDFLYESVMPSFETVFAGRQYQRFVLSSLAHPLPSFLPLLWLTVWIGRPSLVDMPLAGVLPTLRDLVRSLQSSMMSRLC
jgi:hypothetical protein